MKKIFTRNIIILYIGLSSLLTGLAYAQDLNKSQIPSTILFNGYLADKDGNSLTDADCKFTIHIYDSPSSQKPIWSESFENINVKEGLFTLVISAGAKEILIFDKKYYVGIQVNDQAEMPQRLEFGTTAYSLGAKYANTVKDGSITTDKLQDNSVTSDKIKNVSISKITNLPESVGSVDKLKETYGVAGSDYEWWTLFGNIIYGPERHFIGTRNDRDFDIQTNEIDRMRFTPLGYILLGTNAHPVDFEVFGYSIFDYWFVDGNLGVGISPFNNPVAPKMHINAPVGEDPLRVDYQLNPIFTIDDMGRVEITSSVSGGDGDEDNYPLLVKGGEQGIGIDITGNADGDNNYVSFWDDGGMTGRIEGQTAGEYASEPVNIAQDAFLAALIVAEGVAAVSFLYPLPIPTEPADIIRIAADIAEITFNMIWDYAHLGITYESGSGDYAEWLQKNNPEENILAGEIVGVNGGKITKNTSEAEKIMAISTSPFILGNMPKKGEEKNYEKVAFMGQVPVRVIGAVNYGDFIIPSGLNDGTGIAVAPELLSIDELDKVVGRSWEESTNESVKMINMLVGISVTDIGQILKQNKSNVFILSKTKEIERETSELQTKLHNLKKTIKKLNSNLKSTIDFKSTSVETEPGLR